MDPNNLPSVQVSCWSYWRVFRVYERWDWERDETTPGPSQSWVGSLACICRQIEHRAQYTIYACVWMFCEVRQTISHYVGHKDNFYLIPSPPQLKQVSLSSPSLDSLSSFILRQTLPGLFQSVLWLSIWHSPELPECQLTALVLTNIWHVIIGIKIKKKNMHEWSLKVKCIFRYNNVATIPVLHFEFEHIDLAITSLLANQRLASWSVSKCSHEVTHQSEFFIRVSRPLIDFIAIDS